VADKEHGFVVSGSGELIEPDDGVLAIGSGGSFALAAARGAAELHQAEPAGDRPARARDRRRDLRLHQREHHRTRAIGMTKTKESPLPPAAAPSAPAAADETMPWLEEMPPRKIVAELDRYIVGQDAAKKAVAIAVRNRWRRAQAPEAIRDEIMPNNIIMIGPTGVGKTEIARRLARLAGAPFLKVEASKFTESRVRRPRCRVDDPRAGGHVDQHGAV